MSTDHTPSSNRLKQIIPLVIPLLGTDLSAFLGLLGRLGKHLLPARKPEGMYEVLDYEAELELLDTKGKKTVLHKRQRVRFLQDNIIAYQDKAWGDGNIFADYKCSPGVAVDRYREGHRYRILISLRETKKRGEETAFQIERTITNGFTKNKEDFQTEIDHKTRSLTMSVIFPKTRRPKHISLIEQNTTHSVVLDRQHYTTLPDGREQVTWKTDRPRVFEAYILRWEW